MSSADSSLINPQALERLRELMGDQAGAMLPTLVAQFGLQAPQLIVEIRAGAGRGDAMAVRRAAHTLKSNAANFGLEKVREIALAIETQAKNNDLSGANQQADAAMATLARALPLLRELVRGD